MSALEPDDVELLNAAEFEAELAADNLLEDLFDEIVPTIHSTPKQRKSKDPAVKGVSATEALRRRYTDPANWTRRRGLALIDKESQTLIGNYSEYVHNEFPATRKLIREHQPMAVDAVEEVSGYLGAEKELAIRNITWDKTFPAVEGIVLDELGVEAPNVEVLICTRFNATVRVALSASTQFACASGNVLLMLPAGTDILPACSVDTKIALRKWVEV